MLSGLRRIFDALAARLQGTGLEGLFSLGAPGILDNLFFYVCCTVASIIFAGLVFNLFEKPAMALTGRWRRDLFEDTNAQLKPAPIKAAIW